MIVLTFLKAGNFSIHTTKNIQNDEIGQHRYKDFTQPISNLGLRKKLQLL